MLLLSYQSSSASFLAVDKRTGKEIWKTDQQKAAQSYSTPLVIETAKGPEAIVNSSERIESFDPETGKSLWQYNLPHRFAVPMPVFHDGMIYINRGYRSSPFLAIRPGGRGDITNSHVVWNVGAGAPYVSSLIHNDGMLYYVTEQGIANCIEARRANASSRIASAACTARRRLPPTVRCTCSGKRVRRSCSSRAGRRGCAHATSSTAGSSPHRRYPVAGFSCGRTVI